LKNSKQEEMRNGISATAGGERTIPVRGHRIDSRDVFVGTKEVTIGHGEDTYRLRLTGQNKLILTK
jgi:hemin uptake protein HemP